MSHNKNLHFDSKCVHSGIEDYEHGPVVPPIYQTSTFKFKSADEGASIFKGEKEGFIYTRMGNPTINAMEDAVAELEGGYRALGCASGMAAIHTALTSFLKSGDHVVCSKAVYGPTNTLLKDFFSHYNVKSTFVHTSDLEETSNAIIPETKVIFVETPGNPTLEVSDLTEISKIANQNNIKVIVDNTFMSPALQKPFELGVDVIIHSMTKFLNGHADVVAGIIIAKNEEDYKIMRKVLNQIGGVIDPFNSFLVHRGLKTLSLRMNRHSENALKIAKFLEDHPQVEKVYYPGLPSHPQFETGQKQHKSGGGMISFELKEGYDAGKIVMDNVRLCILAVSLGGVETLIQHPASMTHLSMGKEAREAAGISEGLVRISIGIEDADDLISDLENAFKKIEEKMETSLN